MTGRIPSLRVATALTAVWFVASAQPARAPVDLQAPVQDKNFYLLSLIERSAAARQALESDAELKKLGFIKQEGLRKTIESCNGEAPCYASMLKWTDNEIHLSAERLRELYRIGGAVQRLADGPLLASGMVERYRARGGEAALVEAWSDSARGINHIVDVYCEGHAPRYSDIDAVSYDVNSASYKRILRVAAAILDDRPPEVFFQIPLRFALYLLEANNRDEAGRFEPLEKGENSGALRRIATVDWSKFPYSVIVVPGSGGDRPGVSLSAVGKLRLILAARRLAEAKAPFILVSGGFVHPNQTQFCEALEMKKYLVAALGIPADAILIDPHARHTTTNLRNAARLVYRYKIPFDKPGLITTDQEQSTYIQGNDFAARCLHELGYKPWDVLRRTSRFDLEFLPVLDSLQADPMDPLDP